MLYSCNVKGTLPLNAARAHITIFFSSVNTAIIFEATVTNTTTIKNMKYMNATD